MVVSVGAPAPLIIRASPTLPLWPEKTSPSKPAAATASLIRLAIWRIESRFAPDELPDSECRSIAKSCFRYWTLNYDPSRFSEIQTRRNGKRWHNDHGYDFHKQAQDVHELKAWGLKQITIAAVVRLSPGRVSQILSQGL